MNMIGFGILVIVIIFSEQASAISCRYLDENGADLTSNSTQVKDIYTGLIWQRGNSSTTMIWSATATAGSAQEYCNALTLGGSSWRLPKAAELLTLVDYGAISAPSIDQDAFPNTPTEWFWSSTPRANQPDNAWFVNFIEGT